MSIEILAPLGTAAWGLTRRGHWSGEGSAVYGTGTSRKTT